MSFGVEGVEDVDSEEVKAFIGVFRNLTDGAKLQMTLEMRSQLKVFSALLDEQIKQNENITMILREADDKLFIKRRLLSRIMKSTFMPKPISAFINAEQ